MQDHSVKVIQHAITGDMFIPVTPEMQKQIGIALGYKLEVTETLLEVEENGEWKMVPGIILWRKG
jgi:hypothetical protein